ncbi:hypothetical protein QEN19_001184 [Hanseniaspora menglaensis]
MTVEKVLTEKGSVEEFQSKVLKLKLFGSFLSNPVEKSSILYKTCLLYHRMHYNTILTSLDADKLRVIRKDAIALLSTIKADSDSLSICILKNIIGVINVIENSNDTGLLLENHNALKAVTLHSSDVILLLELEIIYYTKNFINIIENSTFRIPNMENAVVLYYLDKICEQTTKFDQIKSSFLKFYCQIKFGKIQDNEVLKFLETLTKNLTFPNATEISSNNNQLELDWYLCIILNYYDNFSQENLKKWEHIVTLIISKTFQNATVVGIASKLYYKFDIFDKSEVFFNNYRIYNEKYLEFHKRYEDAFSILNLANNVQNKESIIHFVNIIYNCFELNIISKKDSLMVFESNKFNSVTIPKVVNDILVDSWIVLYEKNDVNKNVDEAFYCLSNILQLNLSSEMKLKYEYEYAYNLALIKQNEKACAWLKDKVLSVKPEFNLKSWLLLAIVESSKEDKMNALTIANSILSPLEDYDGDGDEGETVDIPKLSFKDRYYYIIFKFMQLDIITDIHGIKDSIELLTNLFQLYETLFSEYENTELSVKNPRFSKQYVLQLVWIQASKMYLLDKQKADALNCLHELSDIKAQFINLNALNMKGFINNDISQFELVLGYEPTNLIALNGLSNMLLAKQDNKSLERANELTALCLKLTTGINNNIQCQFNGQLQYNLYKLYVKLGHSRELQKQVLLTTVENLENDTILDPWILKLI